MSFIFSCLPGWRNNGILAGPSRNTSRRAFIEEKSTADGAAFFPTVNDRFG